MIIQEIGQRGVIFTFDDEISVYLIKGDHYHVLCDTHLGPASMNAVKDYLPYRLRPKELLVFNSHSDWDHIWGNCAFEDALIIGHETTRTRMLEIGNFELNRLKKFHNGRIELKYPNLTFQEKLTLADEGIEFIYAPGHTIDSSLCFDQRDSVLFVGDLVEFPIPYLDYYDLHAFVQTLEYIRNFPARTKLSAHSGIVADDLIERNLAYIEKIQQGQSVPRDMIGPSVEVHQYNLNNLLLLKYEPLIRKKFGPNFDYSAYKSNFSDLGTIPSEDFKAKLQNYLKRL
ncbi:Zn-dependent hydrolase, glyoxylase [Desulfosporosinus acidiphilus SJ4]|uniref:Zn-dependent hydrolase, glyoxylase n=1 Tax=Desulfosporosinus acidiphilus (strain DSM 22704 / JCM 16185 / SJ4) TaxID=646529 RepID=I4D130_DESAJ|nr:MBL fold metallo-hydrolase [Desulfosporosinus acidiphilus]AFM39504.1 Zn-dependent hydrolase, glyoxylase [Desulfosporosinus acidiphilus SJ4]